MTAGLGDKLASGQRSAQFSAGTSGIDETVELKNVAPEEITNGVTVIDRRSRFDSEPVKKEEPKFPEKEYKAFMPILDRVLVKRVPDDPNMELLEDGSMRDKRSGFVIPAKYRQHSNVGVVLATGEFLVMGGVKIPMEEVVKPGDKVCHGEYNAEKVVLPEAMVRELCDSLGLNFDANEDLNLVRVQDVRGVYKQMEAQCKTQS
jgi:co-chaperonin GroES (HSP10)